MAWGETLGCASTYTVTVHYRGGQRVYAYLETVQSVKWGRERRGVSSAEVVISQQSLTPDCAALVRNMWPLAHEITIYRDDRAVWQGPIVRRVSTRSGSNSIVTFHAQDVGYWLGRRMPRQSRKLTGVDLSAAGRAVVESTFSVRDVNILPNVVAWETGRNVTHTINAYARWALDELSELGGQGLEWSFIGRTLFFSGVVDESSQTQSQITSTDLLGEVELELDGDQYASLVYAAPQAQDGAWQHLEAIGGASPYFGLVEYVVQTDLPWNVDEDGNFEPSGEDGLSQAQTVERLVRAAQSRHTQVSRPPITIRCSDGARLSPDAPVSLDRLVPGARFDVAIDEQDFLFHMVRPMRLTRVQVSWTGDGEEIGVSLVQIGTVSDNEIEQV